MTDTNNVVHIAERELEQLICEDATSVRKAKQRMISEDRPQAHCPRMQYRLMTKVTKTGMAMYNFNLLPDYDVPKYGKEREDSREGSLSIDDQKWDMIDLQAIGEVSDTCSASVGMRNYDNFVSAIDKFLGRMRK
jgi:hypothetical protein